MSHGRALALRPSVLPSTLRSTLLATLLSTLLSFLAAAPRAPGETVLVDLGEVWRYAKGTQAPSDPPTAWREPGFDDAGWLEGPSGIGYGDGDDATVLTDMQNNYLGIFTRRRFQVGDPSAVRNLVFSVDYDDGFVAYLNGVEVARRNLGSPGEDIPFDRAASVSHEAGTPELMDLSAAVPLLVSGENTLAIQVHSWALLSSDLTMRPRLLANSLILVSPLGISCSPEDSSGDGRADRISIAWTNRAAYDSIRVLRNGSLYAGPLPGTTPSFVDSDVGTAVYAYEVIATIGGEDCPPLRCTVTVCDPVRLTCALSLEAGKTAAALSWDPEPGAEFVDVIREGTLLATLDGGATGYVDPDVESLEPEDDTDFQVVFRRGSWSCTAACGPISLCPELTCSVIDVGGEPRVRLEWGNAVKVWESFTVLRDGAVIASALPAESASYVDADEPPATGVSVTYTLRPVAPAGRQAACDRLCTVTPFDERPFTPPSGGWDYIIDLEAHPGSPQDLYSPDTGVPGNLDGRWIRAASDSWDGSAPGDTAPPPDGPAPGGIRVLREPGSGPCGEDVNVLQIVDSGDPAAYTPPNNRSILLGLDAGVSGENLLSSGVTFAARWRLTPSPAETDNPGPNGDGESLDAGLGQVGFYFRNDGSQALAGAGPTAGYAIALNSMRQMQFGTNPPGVFEPLSGTAWRSVWVTVADPESDGAYDVRVYLNGSHTPFSPPGVTVSGDGLSLPAAAPDLGPGVVNALGIGLPAAQDDGSIEIDYVALKAGVHAPSTLSCGPRNHAPTARITLNPPGGAVVLSGGSASVELDGSLSDDGDGGVQGLAFLWEAVSGPEPAAIAGPASQRTLVTFTDAGAYEIQLTVDDRQAAANIASARVTITVEAPGPVAGFTRGDWRRDGAVDLSDAVSLLQHLFRGAAAAACLDAGDANDDGALDVGDVVAILLWRFGGGRELPAPGPSSCGPDPTQDGLGDCALDCP